MPVVLADPEVVIIGLAAALLAFALLFLLRSVLQVLASAVPLVFSGLYHGVANLASSIVSASTHWIHSAVTPLADAIAAPVAAMRTWQARVAAGFQTVAAVLPLLAQRILGQVGTQGATSAPAAVGAAVKSLEADYEELRSKVDTLAAELAGAAGKGAVAQTVQQVTQVVGASQSAVQAALGAAAQATALAQAALRAADAAAADVRSAEAAAESYAYRELTSLAQAITAQIGQDIGAFGDSVAATFDEVQNEVKQNAAAAAAVGAAVTALTDAFDTLKRDCSDPMCEGLLGAARTATGLGGMLGLDGLMGFLLGAAADPEAAATAAQDVLGPFAKVLADGVGALAHIGG